MNNISGSSIMSGNAICSDFVVCTTSVQAAIMHLTNAIVCQNQDDTVSVYLSNSKIKFVEHRPTKDSKEN